MSRTPRSATGYAWRQSGACRSGIGIAGLHAGAECHRHCSWTGRRTEDRGADFFTGIYETALSPEELLVAVELPAAPKNSVYFFHEFARRAGDYAILVLPRRRSSNEILSPICGWRSLRSATGRCWRARRDKLIGCAVTPAMLSDACTTLGGELDPQDDQQASASMRRHLAKVLLVRCVAALLVRPDLNPGGSA